MQKTVVILVATISLIMFIFFSLLKKIDESYQEGLEKGKLIELNKCQDIELTKKNINHERNKKHTKRKITNRRISSNANIEFLFGPKRCPECYSNDSK